MKIVWVFKVDSYDFVHFHRVDLQEAEIHLCVYCCHQFSIKSYTIIRYIRTIYDGTSRSSSYRAFIRQLNDIDPVDQKAFHIPCLLKAVISFNSINFHLTRYYEKLLKMFLIQVLRFTLVRSMDIRCMVCHPQIITKPLK